MELIYYPAPHLKKMLLMMATQPLPPLASSAMSTATASAMRTRAVVAKSRDGGAWHFLLPLPLPLLPLWLSLVCQLVVVLMPPPLVFLTLLPPLNTQPRPIKAPPPLVCWHLSSCLPLIYRLVVASPLVVPPPPRVTFCHTAASHIHP